MNVADNQGKPLNFGEVFANAAATALGKYQATRLANSEQQQQNFGEGIKLQMQQIAMQRQAEESAARMAEMRANIAHIDAESRDLAYKNSLEYRQRLQVEKQQELEAQQAAIWKTRKAEIDYRRQLGIDESGKKIEGLPGSNGLLKLPSANELADNITGISGANAKLRSDYQEKLQGWNKTAPAPGSVSSEEYQAYLAANPKPQMPDTNNTSQLVYGQLLSGGMKIPDISKILTNYRLVDPNTAPAYDPIAEAKKELARRGL
jgi:hypothetical protein